MHWSLDGRSSQVIVDILRSYFSQKQYYKDIFFAMTGQPFDQVFDDVHRQVHIYD
jgi:hypothetical protein